MRNFILIITLAGFTQITNAQVRVEYLAEQPTLKGHIKQIIEHYYSNGDSLHNEGKRIENFNEKGYQLDESKYQKNGKLESKSIFDNSQANIVIQSLYEDNGNITFKTISKYDNNGNETEISSYSDKNMPPVPEYARFKFVYNYDSRNNMTEWNTYSGENRLTAKEIFVYNENHQIVEDHLTEYMPDRISERQSFFQYDSDGNNVTSKRYFPNGNLEAENITSYGDFDNHGNWLTETDENRVYFVVGQPLVTKNITKREIEYFQ